MIDTSSMSAYLAPQFVMPKGAYKLARTDREKFIKKLVARAGIAPKDARPGLAYAISKHFVIWFAKTDAARFGEKNVRCLSVTPGNFDTPMGALESGQADVFKNTLLSSATESRKKSPLCLRFFWMSGWAS